MASENFHDVNQVKGNVAWNSNDFSPSKFFRGWEKKNFFFENSHTKSIVLVCEFSTTKK